MPTYNIKTHNVESLTEVAKELGRLKNQFDVLVAIIAEDRIESLEVRNNTTLEKSLFGIGKFLDALREAHHVTRAARGKYAADSRRRR